MNEVLLSRHKATGQFWPMRQNTIIVKQNFWGMGTAVGKVEEERQRVKSPFLFCFVLFFAAASTRA